MSASWWSPPCRQWAFWASSWAAGLPTATTRYWARWAPRRNWGATGGGWPSPSERRDGGRYAEHAGHRAVAVESRGVGGFRQLRIHDRAVRPVHHRGDGGNQSRPVRYAGSRIGARGRVPHRVLWLPLCPLLPGRVCQHFGDFERGRDLVLGWLAASLPQREVAGRAVELRHAARAVCGLGPGDLHPDQEAQGLDP